MFRRRTDHIYATLQSVQRRITKGDPASGSVSGGISGSGSSIAGGQSAGGFMVRPDGTRMDHEVPDTGSKPSSYDYDMPPSGQQELLTPDRPRSTVPGDTGTSLGTSTAAGANEFRRKPGGGPAGLMVSPQLAGVVLVLWLATLFAAFRLGQQDVVNPADEQPQTVYVDRTGEDPSGESPPHPPRRTTAAAYDASGLGHYIVIITQVDPARAEVMAERRARFDNWEQQLHDWCGRAGIPKHFGSRVLPGGGLQFIYGYVEGRLGVDQSIAEKVLGQLRQSEHFRNAQLHDLRTE